MCVECKSHYLPTPALILQGDYFTGSVLSATLTKLVLRFRKASKDAKGINALQAEAMLIMTSVIRVGQSKFSSAPIDEDSTERIMGCLRTLSDANSRTPEDAELEHIYLEDTKAAYAKMVATEEVCVIISLVAITSHISAAAQSCGEEGEGEQGYLRSSGRSSFIQTVLKEVGNGCAR